MLIHNAVITGSLTLNGIDIGDITGSEASVAALNSFSASILSYTSSNNTNISALQSATASLQTFSSSILTYTASNNTNINALQTFSSSILTYTASNDTTNTTQNSRLSSLEVTSGSLINASASFSTRVANTETTSSNLTIASASFSTRVANNEATGSSLVAASASFSTRVANTEATSSNLVAASASFSSSISSLQAVTGSYATTGSNTFVGANYFSNASNAISFTSTSSLYSDGGMRITKDMYVSGTAYFNNVTVYGTQSISYISSSQLNIGTNIISVNTDTPTIRFGGLSVYDSGSTGLTGSILWDSEANHWVYNNPSGSTYSGGMLISGPRASSLGSEQGTTCNAIMKGQGGDHITSSGIFDYGNATCFYGNSHISSSGNACFGGNTTIAGNLGVGTITPGQLIDVYKTSNDAIIRVTSCTAGAYIAVDSCTDGYYGLILQSNSNQRWFIGGYTTSDLTFRTSQTGGSEWLRINRTSGIACFTSTVCAPAIVFCSSVNSGYTPIKVCNPNPGSSAYTEILINNDTTNLAGLFYNSSTRSVDGGVCSLTLYNDSANGNLRLRTGNNLVLATGSPASDRLVINTNGCVGINTTSPGFLLDLKMSGALRTDGLAIRRSTNDNHQLGLWTTGGEMYIDAVTDNVLAAGVLVFRRSLDTGANFSESMRFTATGIACFACRVCSPALTTGILRLSDEATYGLTICKGANSYPVIFADGAQSIGFITAQSGVSYGERLRISHTGEACFACTVCLPVAIISGCVGIGTTAPDSLLHVLNCSNTPYSDANALASGQWFRVSNPSTCTGATSGLLFVALGPSGGNGIATINGVTTSCGSMAITFGTRDASGNVTERMRIASNGKVGIGETTPDNTYQGLTIKGSDPSLRLKTTGVSGWTWVEFVNCSGTNNFSMGVNQTQPHFVIKAGAGMDSPHFSLGSTGVTCFACQVCAPTMIVNNCINIGTTTSLGSRLSIQSANDQAGITMFNTFDCNKWSLRTGTTGINNKGFGIVDDICDATRIQINGAGNVGIGTLSPTSSPNYTSLVINGTTGSEIYLRGGNTDYGYMYANSGVVVLATQTSIPLTFQTNTVERLRVTSTGIACFACQVCAPQYITTQGSSVSYADGSNYLVWSSESEYCSLDNQTNCTLTTMKTWIADRTGCVRLKFAGYISSGPTYWGWRIYRNGTSAYTCQSYATCLETGCSANVHAYTTFSVGIGPVNPGDCITLQMVSTGGGSVPAPGQGQTLYAKEFRIYSTTPNLSAGSTNNVFGDWVGIGTCIPYSNLYINGNNDAAYDATVDNGQDGCGVTLTVRNNSTVTNSFAQLNLQASGDSGRSVGRIVLIRKGSATGDMAFVTEDSNTKAEKLRITSTGNVGIGTCAPNEKLTVWTSSTTGLQTALRLNNPFGFNNLNTGTQIVFSQDRSVAEDLKQGIIAVGQADAGTSATSFMAFYTNNTGLNERLRITSVGNVGVGTQTPCGGSGERTIHLAGNSSTNATVYVSRDGYARTILGSNANGGITGTQSNHNLYVVTNDTARLFINNDGISCFACTVCAPSLRSTGLITGDISSFSHYQQKFNGNYYAGSVVIANNSSGGAASNWVNLARVDDWSSANSRIIAKVTVLYISATSDQGNEHVGYALLNYAGTSYACPMTVSTGATFANSNVGTIRWCSGCLQYCAPSGGYFLGTIKTELATKDGASVTLFCGINSY